MYLEPLKSKLDRYETVLNDVERIFKQIKAERLRNLNSISVEEASEFPALNIGKIPSIKTIISKLENCTTWDQLENFIPILKEIRFLGSPKRTEISETLLKKLEEIYGNNSEDEKLVKVLNDLTIFDQLNPLILPKEIEEEASETYKTIIYTAKDLESVSNQ